MSDARSILIIAVAVSFGALFPAAARADEEATIEPAAVAAFVEAAATQPIELGAVERRRWAVGLQLGMLGAPYGNLGLPLDDLAGIPFDGPIELVVRRELGSRHMAFNAGLGFPHDALGISGWLGFETYLPVAENRICALELYVDPALQLGFAGPDYYVRHGGDFVGFNYGISGPLALAMRAPVGVRVLWPTLRLDTYVEAVSMVTVTPARESFFVTFVGMRFRI